LNTQVMAAPIKLRGNKLGYATASALQRGGKHVAIPNKILAKKGAYGGSKPKGSRKSGAKTNVANVEEECTCEEAPPKESIHNQFLRTYETIGLCSTTIDVVAETKKIVDNIGEKCISLQTLKNHKTKYQVLTNVNAQQRYVQEFGATIQVLKTVWVTVQELFPISVSVDILATEEVCVQALRAVSACVQTIVPVQKNIRYITAAKEQARRVTGACGKINAIHRVHERISQVASRSVTCPENNEEINEEINEEYNEENHEEICETKVVLEEHHVDEVVDIEGTHVDEVVPEVNNVDVVVPEVNNVDVVAPEEVHVDENQVAPV